MALLVAVLMAVVQCVGHGLIRAVNWSVGGRPATCNSRRMPPMRSVRRAASVLGSAVGGVAVRLGRAVFQ